MSLLLLCPLLYYEDWGSLCVVDVSADLASNVSSSAGKWEVRRAPMIQPMIPRPTVSPSQMSRTVFNTTLNVAANTPPRIIPTIKPVVTPIKQPGWARLRPRSRFIITVCSTFSTISIEDNCIGMIARRVSSVKPVAWWIHSPLTWLWEFARPTIGMFLRQLCRQRFCG